ncbi:MAG: hypothetical protein HGA61_01585 [Candidatus Moranbacteria bacterium]|nr:hypothetical protein [Candidatus Moranbacteria bacterium]
MQSIQDKKVALESLNLQLKGEGNVGETVISFLTKDKVEEKIIGELNYLASNSGVFLNNFKIINQSKMIDRGGLTVGSLTGIVNENGSELSANQPLNSLQTTQAVVTISGDYEKLKIFFGGVQHMPLFNSIKTLNITSVEKTGTGELASAEGAVRTITAEIVVDFSHLEPVKASNSELVDFKPEIDEKTVQALENYVSRSVSEIKIDDIAVGSGNPFVQ